MDDTDSSCSDEDGVNFRNKKFKYNDENPLSSPPLTPPPTITLIEDLLQKHHEYQRIEQTSNADNIISLEDVQKATTALQQIGEDVYVDIGFGIDEDNNDDDEYDDGDASLEEYNNVDDDFEYEDDDQVSKYLKQCDGTVSMENVERVISSLRNEATAVVDTENLRSILEDFAIDKTNEVKVEQKKKKVITKCIGTWNINNGSHPQLSNKIEMLIQQGFMMLAIQEPGNFNTFMVYKKQKTYLNMGHLLSNPHNVRLSTAAHSWKTRVNGSLTNVYQYHIEATRKQVVFYLAMVSAVNQADEIIVLQFDDHVPVMGIRIDQTYYFNVQSKKNAESEIYKIFTFMKERRCSSWIILGHFTVDPTVMQRRIAPLKLNVVAQQFPTQTEGYNHAYAIQPYSNSFYEPYKVERILMVSQYDAAPIHFVLPMYIKSNPQPIHVDAMSWNLMNQNPNTPYKKLLVMMERILLTHTWKKSVFGFIMLQRVPFMKYDGIKISGRCPKRRHTISNPHNIAIMADDFYYYEYSLNRTLSLKHTSETQNKNVREYHYKDQCIMCLPIYDVIFLKVSNHKVAYGIYHLNNVFFNISESNAYDAVAYVHCVHNYMESQMPLGSWMIFGDFGTTPRELMCCLEVDNVDVVNIEGDTVVSTTTATSTCFGLCLRNERLKHKYNANLAIYLDSKHVPLMLYF